MIGKRKRVRSRKVQVTSIFEGKVVKGKTRRKRKTEPGKVYKANYGSRSRIAKK